MKRQRDFHAGRGRAFLLAKAKLQKHCRGFRNPFSVIGAVLSLFGSDLYGAHLFASQQLIVGASKRSI